MIRLALLSDTHMRHTDIVVPDCDIVAHCGDFSRSGSRDDALAFLDWFAKLPALRVLTPGNHDVWAEQDTAAFRRACAERSIAVLVDEGMSVSGVRFWGSPVTPRFRNMAYNRKRGAEIRAHWRRIPEGKLDVLLTHGPPHGVLDRTFFGAHVGCADLLEAVKRARPKLHAFGHIHEAAGQTQLPGVPTLFVNAASRRLIRGVRTAPPVVDL